MIRSKLLFVIVSSLVWAWMPNARRNLSGVELTATEIADSGDYLVYRYDISNPTSSTWGISIVKVDISATAGTDRRLPVTGSFSDATARLPGEPHAEVGPITPPGWGASLTRTAELWWFPPSTGLSTSDSIAPGQTKSGFGIRSSYFPGIRTVVAEPTVESCCLELGDTTDGAFYPPRRSFAVSGTTVVPRYLPDEVDLALVAAQLGAVCSTPLWVDDAALCRRLADHLDDARDRVSVGAGDAARTAIDAFLRLVVESREPAGRVTSDAYWLLSLNVRQVSDRLGPGL